MAWRSRICAGNQMWRDLNTLLRDPSLNAHKAARDYYFSLPEDERPDVVDVDLWHDGAAPPVTHWRVDVLLVAEFTAFPRD